MTTYRTKFRTHKGELVTGARLHAALDAVADFYATNAHAVRASGDYASHVTEATKDAMLAKSLALAADVRAGRAMGFSVWQRVNGELTGECVALLTKVQS
jgi:hypothetical protein